VKRVLSSLPPPPQKKPFAITRTRHCLPAKPRKKQQQPREKLTQLTLDLGQSIRTTCVFCGMSYHILDPSDISIHRCFHGKFLSGIDFPETSGTNISIVTPSSSSAERKKVREVLEVVDS
jgi:hypothetical protein